VNVTNGTGPTLLINPTVVWLHGGARSIGEVAAGRNSFVWNEREDRTHSRAQPHPWTPDTAASLGWLVDGGTR